VLYRQRLQVEHELLVGGTPGTSDEARGSVEDRTPSSRRDLVIGVVGMGLIALDIALLLGNRLRDPERRR
jgi:hypothetical protein